jgi:hypothetical protein
VIFLRLCLVYVVKLDTITLQTPIAPDSSQDTILLDIELCEAKSISADIWLRSAREWLAIQMGSISISIEYSTIIAGLIGLIAPSERYHVARKAKQPSLSS